ncbi:glycerol channel [Dimargaris xerosporica]|nr:glycerol channel [Dimargaris xerosporica]
MADPGATVQPLLTTGDRLSSRRLNHTHHRAEPSTVTFALPPLASPTPSEVEAIQTGKALRWIPIPGSPSLAPPRRARWWGQRWWWWWRDDQGQWRRWRYHCREYLAEFFGTFILCALGVGGSVSAVLNSDAQGQYAILVALSWGLGVMLGLFSTQNVSGGHINPALTCAFACWRRFPLRKVPGYLACQLLGAFAASGTLHLLFMQSLNAYARQQGSDHHGPLTASLFTSFPIPNVNNATGFLSTALAGAFITIGAFAVSEPRNVLPVGWSPLANGLFVSAAVLSLTFQSMGGVNPACDVGSRLYLIAAGWTIDLFQASGHYFWVPIVAPCGGAVLGGLAFKLLVNPRGKLKKQ